MPPPMPRTVTISTPGPLTPDPVTGNERPGAPPTATVKAWLSQRPVADVGSPVELLARKLLVQYEDHRRLLADEKDIVTVIRGGSPPPPDSDS